MKIEHLALNVADPFAMAAWYPTLFGMRIAADSRRLLATVAIYVTELHQRDGSHFLVLGTRGASACNSAEGPRLCSRTLPMKSPARSRVLTFL